MQYSSDSTMRAKPRTCPSILVQSRDERRLVLGGRMLHVRSAPGLPGYAPRCPSIVPVADRHVKRVFAVLQGRLI